PRLVGDALTYVVGAPALQQSADDLAKWTRYQDPRRTPAQQPIVHPTSAGLDIAGTGWPGIVKTFEATPGDSYLITTSVTAGRDGDLLDLGTWQQPQLLSRGGAASAGIPASLHLPSWFPSERAFHATAAGVRLLVYSEAPTTDFRISSLGVYHLQPAGKAA